MNQEQKTEQTETNQDGSPKFGRLLIVLFLAVAVIVALTFATEAFYSN
jgi:flagellar basal body-associated protein FliL